MKLDRAVKKEIEYIVLGMVVLSMLMNAVFLVVGAWSYRVLLSNLLAGSAMILNFFLLALAVQKAVNMEAEDAKKYIKATHTGRMLLLALMVGVGFLFSDKGYSAVVFDFWALIPPLFFNRITLMIRGFAIKNAATGAGNPDETAEKEDKS